MNLKRIRIDADGLITQDQKGFLARIPLPERHIKKLSTQDWRQLHDSIKGLVGEKFFCADHIDARVDFAMEQSDGLSRPIRIYYGIEPKCDLACPFCGPRNFHDGFRRAEPTIESFLLKQIADAGTFQIQLTGGEVSIRGMKLVQTVRQTAELGLATILATNGVWRCIDEKEEFVAQLADIGNVVQSKISIEGVPEVHERMRGKGTYSQTINTLALLSKYGLNPRISTTIMGSTCNEENLEHLVRLAERYDAGFQPIPIRAVGRAYDIRQDVPSVDQLRAYTERATELRSTTGVAMSFNFDIFSESTGRVPHFDLHNPNSCGAPLWGVHITHLGDVYACGFAQEMRDHELYNAGKISADKTLLDIWQNSEILRRIRAAGKSDTCNECEHYIERRCWGGCWVSACEKTGSIYGMDPYCFKKTMIEPQHSGG